MKRKSYNPFKMFGAYLGAFIGFSFLMIEGIRMAGIGKCPMLGGAITSSFFDCYFGILGFFGSLTYWGLIFGFLLGWGIHSIFRRLR